MEDRRGFLKTLGKLATAVGITTAAATVPAKAKGEIDHETFMDVMGTPADKAKLEAALKASKDTT